MKIQAQLLTGTMTLCERVGACAASVCVAVCMFLNPVVLLCAYFPLIRYPLLGGLEISLAVVEGSW